MTELPLSFQSHTVTRAVVKRLRETATIKEGRTAPTDDFTVPRIAIVARRTRRLPLHCLFALPICIAYLHCPIELPAKTARSKFLCRASRGVCLPRQCLKLQPSTLTDRAVDAPGFAEHRCTRRVDHFNRPS